MTPKLKIEINNSDGFEKKSYCVLDAFKIFLFALVMVGVVSFALTLVLIIAASLFGYSFEAFKELIIIKYFLTIITPIAYFLLFYFYNKFNKINSVKAVSLKKDINWLNIIIVVILSLTCIFLISPLINLIDYLFSCLGYAPSGELGIPLNNLFELFLAIIFVGVFPAIVEELIFRGVILKGMLSRFKPIVAIIISALMFTLVHGSLQQTFFQFIVGVILGVVVYITGNLLYGIILHFVNNATVLIVSYFAKFSYVSSGTDFTKVINVLMVLLCLIVAIGIIYFSIKTLITNNNENFKKTYSEDVLKSKNFFTNLLYNEKFYFYIALALSIIVWLMNTIVDFGV